MYKQALSHAKITRPSAQGLIKRSGLFNELNDCEGSRLVWIKSPAGYGKTSLLSSYLEHYGLPHLWLQIDSTDRDPATFFSYLRFAAIKLHPGPAAESLPKFSAGSLLDINTFTNDFFAALFDVLPIQTQIVFDSYQHIPSDAPLHEIIVDSINRMTEGARIFFLSRAVPPPAFARLKAYGGLKIFCRRDLKVTREEFRELLRKKDFHCLPDQMVHVFSRFDGWIAGIKFLTGLHGPMICQDGEFSSEAWEDIFLFFSNEIFEPLPDEQKTFLLTVGFLPHMTSQEAQQLSNETHAGRLLSTLSSDGHFCEKKTPGTRPIYEIHPLFREFLRFKAGKTFSDARLSILTKNALRLLIQRGDFSDATKLVQEISSRQDIYEIIATYGRQLIDFEKDDILASWLSLVPEENFQRHPDLNFLYGTCLMAREPAESRVFLGKAFEVFKDKDLHQALSCWSAAVECIVREHVNFSLLDPWLEEFKALDLKKIPPAIELNVSGSHFAALMYAKPESTALPALKDHLCELLHETTDHNLAVIISGHLGEYFLQRGETRAACNLLTAIKEKNALHKLSISAHLHLLYFQANLAVSTGNAAEALSIIEQGLRIGHDSGVTFLGSRFHAMALYYSLLTADTEKACSHQKMLASSATYHRKIESARAHFFAAWQAVNENNFSLAHDLLQTALRLAKSGADKILAATINAALAHVLIVFRQYFQANEHLHHADHFAAQTGISRLTILTNFIKAYLAQQMNNKEVALKLLKDSLILSGKIKQPFFPWQSPALLTPLSFLALESNLKVDFFHNLISRLKLTPPAPPLEYANWPWPIKIYTLGRFELVIDGRAVKFSRKAQQKPLDLLKSIIALGGRKICKFQLANILWSDADGDLQHRSLATTLHRLRKLLGRNDSIIFRNGKLTINPDCCWVDVWAFERLVSKADSSAHSDPVISAIMADKALNLYKGAFLPQESGENWPIAMRERLRNRFLHSVEKFGRQLEEIGKNDEAVERFRKAIDVDPLAEKFYQHLLSCYKRLDRKAEATILYNCCRQMMHTMLNAEPSEKTEEIFRSLNPEYSPGRGPNA